MADKKTTARQSPRISTTFDPDDVIFEHHPQTTPEAVAPEPPATPARPAAQSVALDQASEATPAVPRARIESVFFAVTEASLAADERSQWVFAREEADGDFVIQKLNPDMIPTGPSQRLGRTELLSNWVPDPATWFSLVQPKVRALAEAVDRADSHRQMGELYSAEHEYRAVLRVDEDYVRAIFGLGLTCLDQQDEFKALLVFERLMAMEAPFAPEHKHLFNEFGIQLRKGRLYSQALEYYRRAEGLAAQPDEHLHYNIGRTLYEHGDLAGAAQRFRQALALNPALSESRRFLDYMASRGELDSEG